MSLVHHIQADEAQDAMSVIAKWMGKNDNLNIRFHHGTEVSADIFKGIINIPQLACSSGLTEEALSLLRGRVYHEAGHIACTDLTKREFPEGILFQILNAIEDVRMEREMSDKYFGASLIFRENSIYYNTKIACDVAEGKVNAPLWEGLVAMSLQSNGLAPKWRMSSKAQLYFDAGYTTFCKWKDLRDAKGSLELAKELYEILKDSHEDFKQEKEESQGEGEEGEGEEQESQGQGKGQDESEEQQSGTGNPADFDNEEDEEESKSGGKGEEGEHDAGDEEGQSDASESEREESDGEGSSVEEHGDGESDNASEGEGGTGTESPKNESVPYDTNYETEKTERTAKEEAELEAEMEKEAEGKGLDEYQNEDISEALDDLDTDDKEYLSRRDLDEHNYIKGDEYDKEKYLIERAKIAVSVAAMVRSLEQAMRVRTRSRRNRFQRSGKIDKTRLAQIGKSLSKEVFFKIQKGEKLETAVEIIIDESGSMSGKECKSVRRAAIAVSEALSQLRIPFEVTGSTTKYSGGNMAILPLGGLSRTNPIVYDHFKTFGQQWMNVCHNISKSRAYMHNVDGEVVEYAVRRLLERKETRKIVLTLSDGRPDAGHGNGYVMGQNIVRTCERARQAGVEVYAFGIGTGLPAQYYGEENFVELPTGEDLGPKFASEFVAIVSNGRFKVGR